MASEVVASELRRLDARLPHLDDHERDQIQRSMRRIADKLLRSDRTRSGAIGRAGRRRLRGRAARAFALDPQIVAAVMSPEVGP